MPNMTVAAGKDEEKAKLQKMLEEKTSELEEKTREMERFVYTVSHDLKNPLVAIHGYLSMLPRQCTSDISECKFYLERISKNIDAMEELITDLLEFSRIGRITQQQEDIDSDELVKGICDEFKRREAEVKFIIQKNLPVIRGERNRIAQVFTNLIDNAIKYMGDQPQPKIEIGCRDAGDKWQFYVKDNGIGIHAEHLSRLFKPFERIEDERAANVRGTGIGLAIVKKIVDLHVGEV